MNYVAIVVSAGTESKEVLGSFDDLDQAGDQLTMQGEDGFAFSTSWGVYLAHR